MPPEKERERTDKSGNATHTHTLCSSCNLMSIVEYFGSVCSFRLKKCCIATLQTGHKQCKSISQQFILGLHIPALVSFHFTCGCFIISVFFFSFYCMHGKLLPLQAELGPRAAGTHKRIYHDHSREPAQHMATISNADDQVKQKTNARKRLRNAHSEAARNPNPQSQRRRQNQRRS